MVPKIFLTGEWSSRDGESMYLTGRPPLALADADACSGLAARARVRIEAANGVHDAILLARGDFRFCPIKSLDLFCQALVPPSTVRLAPVM